MDSDDSIRNPDQTSVLDENGRFGDAQLSPTQRSADEVRVAVVSNAVDAFIHQGMAIAGATPESAQVWTSVRCDVEVTQ